MAHFESPLSVEPVSTMFINMQGDPPFLDPLVIDAVEAEINRYWPSPEVLSPVYRLSSDNVHNPNAV